MDTQQIFSGPKRLNTCIETNVETQTIYTAKCDSKKLNQKWKWGFVNETNVRNWLGYGKEIMDKQEVEELSK